MRPAISVIVTIVSDTLGLADRRHVETCLEALQRQIDPPDMEILVTCDGRLPGFEELQQRFPRVRFICAENLRNIRNGPGREHHDELRSVGIREARGDLVALLEDHDYPNPRWAAQMVSQHVGAEAAVGGAIENGIDSPLNWAVYFCDFGRYQNPVPRGPAAFVSDANVCYKRSALHRIADVWADSYNEIRVHAALAERGETLWLSPDIIVYQHRLNLHLGTALHERYIWGRSYAAVRVAGAGLGRRLGFAAVCPLLPVVLILRLFRNVLYKRRNRAAFLRALPLTTLLLIAWSYGELMGYAAGRPAASGC